MVKFIITGFGPFASVKKNPTEELVKEIASRKLEYVVSTNVLEVSTKDVDRFIAAPPANPSNGVVVSTSSSATASGSASNEDLCINVHFGVYVGCGEFLLEKCGYNEMDFSAPDAAGYLPKYGDQILKNGPVLCSPKLINVDDLQSKLKDKYKVSTSTDPGRYLCNYIYYRSLESNSKKPKCDSLFVHVPSFAEINYETQLRFCLDLLEEINKQLTTANIESSSLADSILSKLKQADSKPPQEPKSDKIDAVNKMKNELIAMGFDQSIAKAAAELYPTNMEHAVQYCIEPGPGAGLFAMGAAPSNFVDVEKEFKLIILVRMDLKMSTGKIASQCCHAALSMIRSQYAKIPSIEFEAWSAQGEPIIILKIENEAEGKQLEEKAKNAGINSYKIRDAGRTEVDPGTATVICLGPAEKSKMDAITGHLKLL